MAESKYITVNGVMKKNPNYVSPTATPAASVAAPVSISNAPLAIVSSLDDVMEASAIQEKNNGFSVPMAVSTSETVEMLQEEDILKQYKSNLPVEGAAVLEKIGELFAKYETPLGMINKLMMLTNYKLDFIIDDSGSMRSATDVAALEATDPVKTVIRNRLGREPGPGDKMTRFEEAENRLHIMMDILAYIPVEHMQVRFLNHGKTLILDRTGKTPEAFQASVHAEIHDEFEKALRLSVLVGKGTPVKEKLKAGFDAPGKWGHFLFNDGEPNETGPVIAQQIIARKNPENHALTLISCTNNDRDTEWMKAVDSAASWVAEVDDFDDEKQEVLEKQGSAFPYTRGLWILNQLVASINPFDLDALDENLPLTKYTMDNIGGRQLTPDEYQYYFEKNPSAALYVYEYSRFLTEEVFANQIISKQEQNQREQRAGYRDGQRPHAPLANIASQLNAHTQPAQTNFRAQFLADDLPTAQMSAASLAPHSAMMPPASQAKKPSNSINSVFAMFKK